MPAPSRYADTKIDANGRRVPVSEFEAAEGAARSTTISPDTQIAADGVRRSVDEIDENQVAPVGRTAEALVRDERAAHIAGDASPEPEPADDGEPEDDEEGEPEPEPEPEQEDEKGLADHTVVELKEIAADLEIEGRSGMNKDELIEAIEDAQG